MSAILLGILWSGNDQNAVDLFHLDDLHQDSLVARVPKDLAD
jgi:hypothetical protein